MTKKKTIVLSIILVLGIAVAIFTYSVMQQNEQKLAETKQVAVLNKDIAPYETISSGDVKHINVPFNKDTEGYITEKSELSGMVASDYLIPEELILEDSVVEKKEVKDIKFVTLKADYTRSGSSKIGDVVDVYKFIPAGGGIPSETKLLVEDAVVIAVTDQEGTSAVRQSGNALTGDRIIPVQAIRLAVDTSKNSISPLVEASISGEYFSLVVKNTTINIGK